VNHAGNPAPVAGWSAGHVGSPEPVPGLSVNGGGNPAPVVGWSAECVGNPAPGFGLSVEGVRNPTPKKRLSVKRGGEGFWKRENGCEPRMTRMTRKGKTNREAGKAGRGLPDFAALRLRCSATKEPRMHTDGRNPYGNSDRIYRIHRIQDRSLSCLSCSSCPRDVRTLSHGSAI